MTKKKTAPAKVYEWAVGTWTPRLDPEAVGREIEDIEVDGQAEPDAIVDRARDEFSAMHGYFTWDDTECGTLYRRRQARRLLQAIRVVYKTADGATPKQQRIYVKPLADPGGYSTIERAVKDTEYWKRIIRDTVAHLRGTMERLDDLEARAGTPSLTRIMGPVSDAIIAGNELIEKDRK